MEFCDASYLERFKIRHRPDIAWEDLIPFAAADDPVVSEIAKRALVLDLETWPDDPESRPEFFEGVFDAFNRILWGHNNESIQRAGESFIFTFMRAIIVGLLGYGRLPISNRPNINILPTPSYRVSWKAHGTKYFSRRCGHIEYQVGGSNRILSTLSTAPAKQTSTGNLLALHAGVLVGQLVTNLKQGGLNTQSGQADRCFSVCIRGTSVCLSCLVYPAELPQYYISPYAGRSLPGADLVISQEYDLRDPARRFLVIRAIVGLYICHFEKILSECQQPDSEGHLST